LKQFERKWLKPGQLIDERALEVTHFAAATSAFSITSTEYAMRFVPFELGEMIELAAATLLQFLPAALMALPFEVIPKDPSSVSSSNARRRA